MLPAELRLIAEASEDMPIVVYDDDACSGDTMERLVHYLGAKLPKNRTLVGYVNREVRPSGLRQQQGERWEHCLSAD